MNHSPYSSRLFSTAFSLLLALLATLSITPAYAADSLLGWGNNNNHQTDIPPGLNSAPAIAGGVLHSLALRTNGTVVAWGDNFFGQTNVPPGLSNVIAVAGGETYSLALKSNGTVTVWGTQPAAPSNLTNAIAIAAGWRHCLALRQDNTVVSWGSTNPVPAGLSNVIAIAAGAELSVALLKNGTVTAWGDNTYGQTNVPVGLSNVIAIACGKEHALALKADGRLVAWGRNDDGQTNVPPSATNVFAIAAGASHSIALKVNSTVSAWGYNVFNQTNVPASAGFHRIAAGGYHNLAFVGDASPYVITQPRSQTVSLLRDIKLSVFAIGTQPIRYQWRQNSTNLVGATAASLTITNAQFTNSGIYSVTLSNSAGVTPSADAVVNVIYGPPAIVGPPLGTNVICGDGVVLAPDIDGTPPIDYQWQFQGVPLLYETNATLTITNVGPANVGAYTIALSNAFGVTTGAFGNVTITVEQPYITSELFADGIQCQPFTNIIIAPHAVRFEATDLPPGLTLDTTNGIISGLPMNYGTFASTISAMSYCATQSETLTLTFFPGPPVIVGALTAVGTQGQPFSYTISALYSPIRYDAFPLPLGLSIDKSNGVISGIPIEAGTFTPTITAYNPCTSYSEVLTLNFSSAAPVITSASTISRQENQPLTYQITATRSPFGFGGANLPDGLSVNPTNGLISGQPLFPGDYDSTIFATNIWGAGFAPLHFTITNRPVTGLSIANVTYSYSSPYLLDFQFSLRDNDDPEQGNAIATQPQALAITAKEGTQTISPSETAVLALRGNSKQVKANLVLDFSESVASLSNGDTNSDGVSDAVDNLVLGAQIFVNQQPKSAQIGVYEFHREDFSPAQVVPLTTDKALLNRSIAGIWTNYVGWFPAASRCWDAITMAITNLGPANPDEQHYVVFISDGRDESSLATVTNVITLATNNNVQIYCVGFGDEVDEATLINITTETHGRYYRAANPAELATQFGQIGKDVNGQYLLRWATLKRSSTAFMPSFSVTYQGLTAFSPPNPVTTNIITDPPPGMTNYTTNFIIAYYIPTQHTGTVTQGALRLSTDSAVSPTSITLRARYIPRFIRQLRLHYRANWPCTTSILSTNVGELLYGWSLTETNDGAGGKWLSLASTNTQSLATSLQFAALGDLIHFNFQDILSPTNAFSLLELDNTIYTNTGGQKFVIENTNAFVVAYTNLPYGTPIPWMMAHGITSNFLAAELADPDGDGVPTWQEYIANTDPQNAASKLRMLGLSTDIYGRYFVTFDSAPNRTYRLETSYDFFTWEVVEDNIPGVGGPMTILDRRYIPWASQVFYRAVVH